MSMQVGYTLAEIAAAAWQVEHTLELCFCPVCIIVQRGVLQHHPPALVCQARCADFPEPPSHTNCLHKNWIKQNVASIVPALELSVMSDDEHAANSATHAVLLLRGFERSVLR